MSDFASELMSYDAVSRTYQSRSSKLRRGEKMMSQLFNYYYRSPYVNLSSLGHMYRVQRQPFLNWPSYEGDYKHLSSSGYTTDRAKYEYDQ